MNRTHALTSGRPGGWFHRRNLVAVFVVLLLGAAGSAQAKPHCRDLDVSLGPEPEWYARECVVNLIAPEAGGEPAKSGSDLAYALESISNSFVSHPLNDFPGQDVEGTANRSIAAMDFDPTSTILYAIARNPWELGTINLNTGVFTAIGPSAPPSGEWTGLAIHPVNGTLYASSSNLTSSSLSTLHPATGQPTLIGTDQSVDAIIAIAVNCQGEMYGHDIFIDVIYEINPATGVASFVGSTGVNSNFGQGMDFDNESGVLYAWTFQGGAQANNQYGTINLATGDLTPLATNMPLGRFEGATKTTCPGVMVPLIFADGFESGNANRWSDTNP